MFKRGVTYKRDEIATIARPEDTPTEELGPQVTHELKLTFSSL